MIDALVYFKPMKFTNYKCFKKWHKKSNKMIIEEIHVIEMSMTIYLWSETFFIYKGP